MTNNKESLIQKEEKALGHLIQPFVKSDFKLKDILQIIIGATILAVPIGFTEETWRLGEQLPLANIFGIMAISVIFIIIFTYYYYHHTRNKENFGDFFKRVTFTYLISFLLVAIILGLIQVTPWETDAVLAFKRVIIVALPSSMSAVIADTFK